MGLLFPAESACLHSFILLRSWLVALGLTEGCVGRLAATSP